MRLIDADALMDELTDDLKDGDVLHRIPPGAIDDAPTVDAVPVVRCRECKWFAPSRPVWDRCVHPKGLYFATEDTFCSHGERRKLDEEK